MSRVLSALGEIKTGLGLHRHTAEADGGLIGAVNIGDVSGGNYVEIKSDGEINLHGTARVFSALWLGAEGLRAPPLTKPAAFVEVGISAAWEFSDATDDTVVANMRIPSRMDRTVAPTISLGWSSPTADPGDDSKRAVWQVEYLWTALNESVAAAADGTLSITTSASTVANGLVLSTVTPAAPGATDHCLHTRIKRLGADGADTLGDVAHLSGMCMLFTSDKLGTAT